jgi:hypothetical protein
VLNGAKKLVPFPGLRNTITYFVCVKAQLSTGNFIIGNYPSKAFGFVNAAGIKPYSFTASYTVAEKVRDLIKDMGIELNKKFNPIRKKFSVSGIYPEKRRRNL